MFEKGRAKTGGRQKGVSNKATADLKQALGKLYTEDQVVATWKKWRSHKDPRIASDWDRLAIEYLYGKPKDSSKSEGTTINISFRRDPETPAVQIPQKPKI